MMARDRRRLIAGALFLVFLLRTTDSQARQYGFFSGESNVTIPNSQWGLRNWTQISFRTCNSSGEILSQRSVTGDQMLQIKLHNGSLEFHWRLNNVNSSVSIGRRLNNNTWYTCDLKYHLGSLRFSVSEVRTTLFSQVVANSSYFSYLLDVRLQGTDLVVGSGFTGCIFSGVGVNLSRSDLRSYGVTWDSCPLVNQSWCGPGDENENNCWNNPCQNGRCIDGFRNFTCECPHNFNGTLCEYDLSYLGCDLENICQHNGTCERTSGQPGIYRCNCIPGYTGKNCGTEIDECQQNLCEHGQCMDQVNGYLCNCSGTGYEGIRCSNDVNECLGNPQLCGNGTCSNSPGTFSCVCGEGFEGLGCLEDVDECLSDPCRNGGSCTAGVNAFHCTCQPGFTGMTCEVDIDDCVSVTCIGNNTKCVDDVNSYKCVCKEGYEGLAPVCRDIDECAQNPCHYGATCHDLENAFTCDCPSGYNGTRCEVNINECDPNPCENGGTCEDGVDSYSCECVAGYRGDNCTENIQECAHITCQNGGTCSDGINTFECECTAGWRGTFCDQDINECDSNPCLNGATCQNHVNNYSCSCQTGFSGFSCSVNIDDCFSNPCENNGTCVDDINNYNCSCTPGWMGKDCTEPYNACIALSPCQNGGTCQNISTSPDYNCTCPAGFNDYNCSTNINDCRSDSCQSFEQCYDGVENFTCGCPIGFTGDICNSPIDECDTDPCQNGGTCLDGVGDYTCSCVQQLVNLTKYTPGRKNEFLSGWEGKNCDVDINECNASVPACLSDGICRNSDGGYTCYCGPAGNSFATGFNCESASSYCSIRELENRGPPCQHGGTCVDVSTGIRIQCLCAPGYTGDLCEVDIDECETHPCQYNGTCVDDINGYNCTCIPGITGNNCQININECWPVNPCLNYGTCNDKINETDGENSTDDCNQPSCNNTNSPGYVCDCSDTGFNGTECQNNIDDCGGVTCLHDGTCVDGIKRHDCACLAGYTGVSCETDINECLSIPCHYNGTCFQRSNRSLYGIKPGLDNFSYATAAGYICECIPGITGPDCEVNIDDCENHPCANGATCKDLINDFQCECAPGFKGDFCRTEINECDLYNACKNMATCEDKIADYYCRCQPYRQDFTTYGGKNCTVELTGCNNNTECQNGATCIPKLTDQGIQSFSCRCLPGYRGARCEISTTLSFANGAKIVKSNVQNFTLQLRFRTTLKSAMLVVYKPNSGVYISVEISHGHLYAVYGDSQKVHISKKIETKSIVNDGEMHGLRFILKQNITLKVESSLCNSREECTESFAYPVQFNFIDRTLYIGNLNQSVTNATLSGMAFTGCMEDIKYNIDDYLMLTESNNAEYDGVDVGCIRTDQCLPYTCNRQGQCHDLWNTFRCDCHRPFLGETCAIKYEPATFSMGNLQSWARFDIPQNYSTDLKDAISLSLFMRTRQMNGVIMYFGNTEAPRSFISLEMWNGKLAARFYFCGAAYFIPTSTQYNNGQSHFVKLEMTAGNFTFSINNNSPGNDDQFTNTTSFTGGGCTFSSQVAYFGGKLPDSFGLGRRRRATEPIVNDFSNSTYFQGIVQDVEANGIKFQFYPVTENVGRTLNMAFSSNLTQGENSTEKACDESPCQQNGTCTDKFYNDFSCECPYGYRGKDCSELDFCRNATCPANSYCQSLHKGYECIRNGSFDGYNSVAWYSASLDAGTTIKSVSLKLRTRVLYGTLLHIQDGAYFMKLRVADGELQLNYKLKNEISNVVNVQHKIYDGGLYEVRMTLVGDGINIQVWRNSTIVKEADITVENPLTNLTNLIQNRGEIYVGSVGQPNPQKPKEQAYKGCLEEVRIGGFLLPFMQDNILQNNDMRTEYFQLSGITAVTDNCTTDQSRANLGGRNGATCEVQTNGEIVCLCRPGFTGHLCEVAIDNCTPQSCLNGGVCVDGHLNTTCRCRKGFTGERCQEAVNFCDGVVCGNNGTCQNTTTGYVCNCTEDFTGNRCSVPVNQSCRGQLCEHGATCNNISRTISSGIISSFNCTCAPGYEGPLCQTAIDYCADIPCGAWGTCESLTATQSFRCSCEPGFEGSPCVNVNDCDHRATCHNGATCVDGISNYTCNCTDGWLGPYCQTDIDECEFNPCQHGVCRNSPGSYRCDCNGTGFDGEDCSEQVNECDESEPCQNGGTCTDTEGSYNCSCTLGYKGKDCQIPDCDAGQCENGGTCLVDGTKWTCDCVQYYEGDQCEIPGPCLNQTCELENTEECVQNITLGNYTCNCLDGWEGDTCTVDINECDRGVHVCQNGATCVNTDGSYNCSCTVGYTGRYCQTDIDDCISHDCEHNGLCEDLVNGFKCNCSATGYEGDKCTIDINECQATASPCTGNRDCINTDGSYKCKCKEGFIGADCSKDPCLNTICQNDGLCNSSLSEGGIWEPTCSCSEGYEGSRCEKTAAIEEGGGLNIWYIIGPVIAVVLLIVIIGIVIFVMMARTKRATRGTYSPSRQETSGARVELGNVLKKPPEERLI